MFKQLKIYYIFVALPFVLLLLGAAFFIEPIKSTITKNPHPQINYTIFVIVLVGGTLIIINAYRLIREAKTLIEFSDAIREKFETAVLQSMSSVYTGETSCILQMLASSVNRSISHQEQAAIEHELSNSRSLLTRRNALPQYLSGLLVGMGLLGTFIGLLATLNDISALIGSFADLDMNTVSPIAVFRTMIERMKAPMQSMGIAFSASMFGLLGSIILGLMMLGLRRLQGDIISTLGSLVAKHIETARSYEDIASASTAVTTTSAALQQSGTVNTFGDSAVLTRIEERLAELVRTQQRMLASEIQDFQNQRADMLRGLAEQTESNNNFRTELQQLGRHFETLIHSMDKGNSATNSQLSDLTVQLVSASNESHKLLALQADEQKKLRDTIDSYKIEERLAETARFQQQSLSAEIDDFQRQRAEMISTISEQTEANNKFRSEMQQLGIRLGDFSANIGKGNDELYSQITELMIHMTADAKESQKLMAMQIQEQVKLRETLDWRSKTE